MPEIVTHPTPQMLSAFDLGRLPEAAAATVASHLDTCPDCRQAVEKLPADSLQGKVRAAKPGGTALPQPPASARLAAVPSAFQSAPAPAGPPAGLPPQLADHPKYRILRELGRGGMGVVYQALQTMMDRQVVVKVINQSLLANPDALQRFRREVQAAASLSHPNIVTAYDAEQAGDLHLLVMEFVPGLSLAQVLEQKGPLPVARACHYVRQAALGLQHAFEQGMVHRDIKPQNLMLTPKGQVKVLDFGLARLRGAGPQAGGLTQTGAFMGTPEYVSPEQATDARTADIRADLYSLGCTLYFLLTGRPPFVADTAVKLVLAHIEKVPTPLHALRAEVPEALSAVVGRLLAKDPGQRYQTPVELAQALVPFIKAGAKGVTPKSSPDLLMAATEAEAAGAKAAKPERPTESATGLGKRNALATDALPPIAWWDTRTENSTTSIGPGKSGAVGQVLPAAAKASSRKQWLIGGGIVVCVLLLGLVGMWAGGVFKAKTPEGILVVEVNEPNPDVYVDGEKVTVSWDGGGTNTEIRVQPGSHKVEIRKDGFSVDRTELTFEEGGREYFTARLLSEQRAAQTDPPPGKPLPEPDRPAQEDMKDPKELTTPEERRRLSAEEKEKAQLDQAELEHSERDAREERKVEVRRDQEQRDRLKREQDEKRTQEVERKKRLVIERRDKREREAASQVRVAWALIDNLRSQGESILNHPDILDKARARLRKVTDEYPDTKAAQLAKKRLEELER
ncbi:MAG TPA: protein kinase [Gemmataceae bacterium]|nr:protein kinase [Gemmataceae bacterium]